MLEYKPDFGGAAAILQAAANVIAQAEKERLERLSALPLEVLVECLSDESGSEYCVSLAMGGAKLRSKWGRSEKHAEKLAATIRDAFGVRGMDDQPEEQRK